MQIFHKNLRRSGDGMSTSNQSNAAAVRAFRVLETLAQAGRPLSMTDLVDALALPKQTVHRILVQLTDAYLITRGAGDRLYECSPRVRSLAVNVLMHAGPAAARHALLEQLVEKIGETCNLTMLSGMTWSMSTAWRRNGRCACICNRVRMCRCTVRQAASCC